jgi:hypothetical protein
MADILVDGYTRVSWVPTISNIAAPTTTELNAGTTLQSVITADGLIGFEASTSEVDTTALSSTFNTKTIGRDDFSGTMLRLKKQSGTDTAYTTLIRGATGYIVIRRDVLETTAWTSAQAIQVFPVICGQTKRLTPEANTVARWEVPTMITSAPDLRSAVA